MTVNARAGDWDTCKQTMPVLVTGIHVNKQQTGQDKKQKQKQTNKQNHTFLCRFRSLWMEDVLPLLHKYRVIIAAFVSTLSFFVVANFSETVMLKG